MSGLRARPVRRCRRAGYPTRMEVRARPELLRTHVPREWLGNRELAAALATALALETSGCSSKSPPPAAKGNGAAALSGVVYRSGQRVRTLSAGRWLWTRYTLSEEESLQVVREELSQAGLEMSESGGVVEGVTLPGWEQIWVRDWISDQQEAVARADGRSMPLIADLGDPRRRVYVDIASSQEDRDEMTAAALLARQGRRGAGELYKSDDKPVFLASQGIHFGSFRQPSRPSRDWQMMCDLLNKKQPAAAQEPAPRPTTTQEATAERARQQEIDQQNGLAECRRLLREQVKDFVEWLKGQGVI